jgi:hypothetical protein
VLHLVHKNGSRRGIAIRNSRSRLRVYKPAHQRADEDERQERKDAHAVMLLHVACELYPPLDVVVEAANRGGLNFGLGQISLSVAPQSKAPCYCAPQAPWLAPWPLPRWRNEGRSD